MHLLLVTANALVMQPHCFNMGQSTLQMVSSSEPPKTKGYLGKRPRSNPYRYPSINPIVKAIQNSTHLATANAAHDARFVSLLSEMHERNRRGEVLTQAYCDSVLGLCVACNEWDSVLEVMELMRAQNIAQERSTYRACLQACFDLGNGLAAKEILDAMRTAHLKPDSIDIALVVATMCRNDKVEKGWYRKALNLLRVTADTFEEGDDVVPVEAYDTVLNCMVKEEQWKDSLRLLNAMEQGFMSTAEERPSHPLPMVSTYRIVIETCLQAQQTEQAFQTLLSMTKRGLTPTAYAFEIVAAALANKLQWRRALQLLELMDEMEIQKTVVTYNIVISACAKAGEVGTANNLLRRMRKAGVQPNIISFNSVMSACVRTSRWKEALLIFDQCQREPGVNPDIITFTNVMRACVKGGKTQKALTLLQVAKDKGLALDNYAYAAAIDACAKDGMWQKGLELLDEMMDFGVQPNEVTFSIAINACGNGGQWKKAMDLLNLMKDKGMKINLITYNSAITALAKAARRNTKQSVKNHATKKISSGNGDLLEIDEEQLWTRAVDLLEQIKEDGLEPDGFSFSATISCCGSGGRWEEALKLIKTMHSGSPKTRPNKISYTAAISACGRSGEYQHALELFNEMKNQGLLPDLVAYNSLFFALRVANEADKAYELWKEMCGEVAASSDTNVHGTARLSKPIAPDIITVTDVIAALTRSNEDVYNDEIDSVFNSAFKNGLVLRNDNLDSHFEVDLSTMSFPVARAACRFIFNRIKEHTKTGGGAEEVSLITGIGVSHLMRFGGESALSNHTLLHNDNKCPALREFVRECLVKDFNPPIASNIPQRAQGIVHISKESLEEWLAKNQQ